MRPLLGQNPLKYFVGAARCVWHLVRIAYSDPKWSPYRSGPPTEEACWPARRRVPVVHTRPSSRPRRYAADRQGERQARLQTSRCTRRTGGPAQAPGRTNRRRAPTSARRCPTCWPLGRARVRRGQAPEGQSADADRVRPWDARTARTSHGSPMQPARALVACPPPERQLRATDLRRAESAAIVRHVNATYSAEGDSLSASGPTSHDQARRGLHPPTPPSV